MGGKRATRMDNYRITKKLEEVCRKVDEEFCEYIDPTTTDGAIAEELEVPEGSVALQRRDIFGKLRSGPGAGYASKLEARIVALEKQTQGMANQLGGISRTLDEVVVRTLDEVVAKHTKLCQQLAVDRVANVRHLAVEQQRALPLDPSKGRGAA
jgi:hypothetical protein